MLATKVALVLIGGLIPVARAYECEVVTREETTNYGELARHARLRHALHPQRLVLAA